MKIETLAFQQSEIEQVAIIVEDLEKAVDRYWNLFKIGPWQFYTYNEHVVRRMTYRGQEVYHEFRVANAKVGNLWLELIEVGSGPTIFKEFIENHGYGVHHFGIHSDNTERSIKEAEGIGLEMIQSGEGLGLNNDGHYAYIDTEKYLGVIIEFREPPSKRWPPDKQVPSPIDTPID